MLLEEGRPTDFLLIQMPGPSFGLKPGIEGERKIAPNESDIRDLYDGGLVRLLDTSTSSVVARFSLTVAGRSAGESRTVTADVQLPPPETAAPTSDAILQWLYGLSASAEGAAILNSGGALVNEALSSYGPDHIETVARRIFDLRDSGLVLFDDVGAEIQVSDADQLGMAQDIRLSTAGVDRVARRDEPTVANITQNIHATQAQVAPGDIHNYASYDELMDRLAEALTELDNIDDEVREEARGLLDKLRSVSGRIAVGAAADSGGAVLGTLLKHALNL